MPETETTRAELMQDVARGATNDEILEVAFVVHELLVERAENAIDMALEANDRDALNEAYVFISRVHDAIPSQLGNKNARAEETYWRWFDVKKEAAEAVNGRAGLRGPAPVARRKPKKREKEVTLEPFTDDELVCALATACNEWDAYRREYGHTEKDCNRGAWASCVACALAGINSTSGQGKVRHADVIRVGQRLGRLMREGRIVCVSAPYESRRYIAGGGDDG